VLFYTTYVLVLLQGGGGDAGGPAGVCGGGEGLENKLKMADLLNVKLKEKAFHAFS